MTDSVSSDLERFLQKMSATKPTRDFFSFFLFFNLLHFYTLLAFLLWLFICLPFLQPAPLWFAVLLVLFNKAALSSYSFPCANVITLLQVDPIESNSFAIITHLFMLMLFTYKLIILFIVQSISYLFIYLSRLFLYKKIF